MINKHIFRGRFNNQGGRQTIRSYESKKGMIEFGTFVTPEGFKFFKVSYRNHQWEQGRWTQTEFAHNKKNVAESELRKKLKLL